MSEAYDNHSIDNNSIEIQLQVRLMNLVMGEASDFERDQLQLLMEQRPELAAYCKHIEHLHGLLSEVGAGEPTIDVDAETAETEWRLPADRRERVLSVLENRSSSPPEKVTLAKKGMFRSWRLTTMEAIVVASIACVVLGLMLPGTYWAREGGLARSVRSRSMIFDSGIALDRGFERDWDEGNSPQNNLNVPSDSFRMQNSPLYSQSILNDSSVVVSNARSNEVPAIRGSHPNTSLQSTLGTASPSFSPNVDFEGRNNFGVSPSTGVPGVGTPDVSNLPNSFSSFLAYRDTPKNTGSNEGKVAAESDKGKFGDLWAVKEDRPADGEQQLTESNFGGRAANGKYEMALRGGTAAGGSGGGIGGITQGLGPGTDSGVASMPMSGEWADKSGFTQNWALDNSDSKKLSDRDADQYGRGRHWEDNPTEASMFSRVESPLAEVKAWDEGQNKTNRFLEAVTETTSNLSVAESAPAKRSETINGAIIPGLRNKLSKSGQEDRVENDSNGEVDYPNIQSPIPALPSDSEQLLAQSDEKVWQKLGTRRLERYGDIILSPRPRDQLEDNSKIDSVQSTATAPSGGSISLGGIRRYFKNDVPNTSNLMMTVTPRVIIPEEEEEPLGVNLSATGPEISSRDRVELKKDAKPAAPMPPPISRGETTSQQNADYVAAGRINIPSTPGEIKNEEMRNWKSKTAPSPELATNGRDEVRAKGKPSTPKQQVALDEQSAAAEAFSTFSLHVSDVSFKLAQAALSQSQWPEPAKIRIEEFVNALDYHDPLPSGDQKIACRVEQAIHPFVMQRNLLRVSMRTAAAGRSQNTPLRLTLLLDNSGSMERPDRRQAVLRAFQTLTQQLKATDQVTLISFASSPRLLADKVPGNQGETLLKMIETLPSEGGTNIESALQLAREKATEQQVAGAQNRIVLLTDGAVNLGDANPENLARQVTQMRDSGIAFDAAGISAQDLNDEVLEALTRQGDGRYYLLDSAESASESFAAQIAGSLRPSAQNVKVQVEFNPQRVGRYKLLGYEKHRLNKEDFRNDQVDAAELAVAEAGVAVYQYEIKPKGSGDVGSVSVRFRDLTTGQMVERRWPILYESNTPRLEQSQPSMQLAAAAALFAAKLGGGPLADSVDMTQLQKIVAKLPEQFASQPRVQQLRAMIEQAIAIH